MTAYCATLVLILLYSIVQLPAISAFQGCRYLGGAPIPVLNCPHLPTLSISCIHVHVAAIFLIEPCENFPLYGITIYLVGN